MAPEYEINTVMDFQKVPDDRIADCLMEFAECVLRGRACSTPEVRLSLESFTWIDDGIPMVRSVDLRIGDKTENIPNPKFPQP